MIHSEVIIVGGGPAGAACAWRLRQNQVDCLVLDQSPFPRLKPCAGWITPQVLKNLKIEINEYPCGITTFNSFYVSFRGIHSRTPGKQYAIRRYEFDEWLLNRAAVPLRVHTVRQITPTTGGYSIDGEYFARYLVGAGGTYCPVYRNLFEVDSPRDKKLLVVAQQDEFQYSVSDAHCHLWFQENHLPGYAWYVPKVNSYVNVGVGGFIHELQARHDSLKRHWDLLVQKLERMGLVHGHSYKPVGHSYYVRSKVAELRKDNAFLVGDSAGLATLDMGEGIGPAIQSGLLAAEAILNGGEYRVDSIPRYSQGLLARIALGQQH
jgi:flavin-dependent dehydrogenase